MHTLYTLTLHLYGLLLRLAALFNPKAGQWVAGRREWRSKHQALLEKKLRGNAPVLWVHCASLGEFEQGRPVIEQLKAEQPSLKILLTFFSPSGYEVRKNYAEADYIVYLPLDTAANARDFVAIWQPTAAVFVKYEFWYYHLRALREAGIPTVLISALFRQNQLFFRWYGGFFRQLPGWFTHIFVQNESSARQLREAGFHNYSVAGDTRIDRVLQIAERAPSFSQVERFAGQAPILMIGSSWPEDEAFLLPFLNKRLPSGWKAIMAPHQVDEGHIQQILKKLELPCCRYSRGEGETEARVLLIDNVGMLSALYQYGRIAYIGGAFGAGLHNTLEPIAFGLPVIFGPRFQKFEEARYLVQSGGGFSISGQEELQEAFSELLREDTYREASEKARAYVLSNSGASRKAAAFIQQMITGS
ncbi:MAG: 3-deoxy-D-manno-octulosonic acid transferase [Lewinellaceae bacterium]|nr:3-deoxy-D-manno-octulosonic acid transferase [Phaeodactylibacter sp.]MCB0616129.1 3-deoxy-D-manno-octulosonic acid transferase [Phaeodactylibacter sp.]MCB9351591.1 3-deoxy-D-manno-octulosonic acid transferase [Lewinellaceae bacterium]